MIKDLAIQVWGPEFRSPVSTLGIAVDMYVGERRQTDPGDLPTR